MKPIVRSLQQLLPGGYWVGAADVAVRHVTADSRHVKPGDLFVAIRGARVDAHDHLQQAASGGAVAAVVERHVETAAVPQYVVPCSSTAYARLCMHQQIGSALPPACVGVTGTNGKTTTTFMLRSILQAAGLQTGLIGTIETCDGVEQQPSTMTTPTADVIARHVRSMLNRGTSHCVVEISSHALVQKRCAGLDLSAAAITNITQDHFDYHRTEESYRAAKAKIVELLHPDAPLLINMDDKGCRSVLPHVAAHCPMITYSTEDRAAELKATSIRRTHRSQRVSLQLAQGTAEFRLRLIGRHNVSNSLAAAGLAEQLGVRLKHIVAGLEAIAAVPGRLERVNEGQPFQVLVDYAHTPDALSRSLETIREFVPGRLICVFGAGGDRDRTKRPLMGSAASAADFAIVTADNPRSEPPQDIIRDIASGFSSGTSFSCEPDRRQAIAQAIRTAEPGDVVLIAGKGHEDTQEVCGQYSKFDDRDVARQILLQGSAEHSPPSLPSVFSLPRMA